MFDRAGVNIDAVERVVHACRNLPTLQNAVAEEGEIGNEVSTGKMAVQGASFADILNVRAFT